MTLSPSPTTTTAAHAPVASRRDRKKSETRDALRAAALRLALEHGYDQLTVEAITAEADVSLRTFFNYFSSKDDALLAPDVDRAAELARALVARPAAEPPVVALRAVFLGLADLLEERQPLWQARNALLRANPHLWPRMAAGFVAFERSLAEAVAARTGTDPDRDLYPGVVAASVVGALRAALAQWRTADAASLPALLSDAFDVLAGGLSLPAPAADGDLPHDPSSDPDPGGPA